jgi:hypothetical protein
MRRRLGPTSGSKRLPIKNTPETPRKKPKLQTYAFGFEAVVAVLLAMADSCVNWLASRSSTAAVTVGVVERDADEVICRAARVVLVAVLFAVESD